jgi:hypothetical protein
MGLHGQPGFETAPRTRFLTDKRERAADRQFTPIKPERDDPHDAVVEELSEFHNQVLGGY